MIFSALLFAFILSYPLKNIKWIALQLIISFSIYFLDTNKYLCYIKYFHWLFCLEKLGDKKAEVWITFQNLAHN